MEINAGRRWKPERGREKGGDTDIPVANQAGEISYVAALAQKRESQGLPWEETG